jgi:hypothetical protein
MTAVALQPLSRLVRVIVGEIQLPAAGRGQPITLSGEGLDAIAEQVEELVGVRRRLGVVDAGALAAELGVARDWVYANAESVGRSALGDGRRARLRSDAERAREAPSDSVGIATHGAKPTTTCARCAEGFERARKDAACCSLRRPRPPAASHRLTARTRRTPST